jgi:hypothetical protein
MESHQHKVDEDGVRIIYGDKCASIPTIRAAIEAMEANRCYDVKHNTMLLDKLYIALAERENHEFKLRFRKY